MKISSVFTNKNLILGFLDVPEGSFQDTSLSTYFAKQNKQELLSRNFSSIVSMDRKDYSDSLSLILEYSQSFIDDYNNDFDTSKTYQRVISILTYKEKIPITVQT
jgi:hypothetical protein